MLRVPFLRNATPSKVFLRELLRKSCTKRRGIEDFDACWGPGKMPYDRKQFNEYLFEMGMNVWEMFRWLTDLGNPLHTWETLVWQLVTSSRLIRLLRARGSLVCFLVGTDFRLFLSLSLRNSLLFSQVLFTFLFALEFFVWSLGVVPRLLHKIFFFMFPGSLTLFKKQCA